MIDKRKVMVVGLLVYAGLVITIFAVGVYVTSEGSKKPTKAHFTRVVNPNFNPVHTLYNTNI